MLLETFKPDVLPDVYEQVMADLNDLKQEIGQYDHLLQELSDPAQRRTVEANRAQRVRQARLLRERLQTFQRVKYSDDADAIWQRTLQVA